MDAPFITHIELSYLEDGTVIVNATMSDPLRTRPTLTVTITSPSAELATAALEIRDGLRPHLLSAARASIPGED